MAVRYPFCLSRHEVIGQLLYVVACLCWICSDGPEAGLQVLTEEGGNLPSSGFSVEHGSGDRQAEQRDRRNVVPAID